MSKDAKPLGRIYWDYCPPDCQGKVLGKRYCAHLEAQLPSLKKTKSVDARASGTRIEQYSAIEVTREQKVVAVEAKLKKIGLEPWEVELVVGRVVDGRKLKDFGWESESSVRYHLRRLYKILKERLK